MKLALRIKALLLALLLSVGLAVVGTMTNEAAAVDWNRPSRLYNNTGSYWVPMYPVPRATQYPTNWSRPGSVFYMHCYTDHQWYTGNYSTNRWFYGYNGSWGYIHASYVYNQIGVPRC